MAIVFDGTRKALLITVVLVVTGISSSERS